MRREAASGKYLRAVDGVVGFLVLCSVLNSDANVSVGTATVRSEARRDQRTLMPPPCEYPG